ncbi:MAG: hypothetical protein DI536_03785 [Archangium gephyra]|uniref:Uncharacterized protein n=1 Tax=Archangium gephyra TaxID=48 RepID=A0A2W5TVY4_9BACT|nr:MAG: hypothetical protein DI536_03785 [Archangium gephyra]
MTNKCIALALVVSSVTFAQTEPPRQTPRPQTVTFDTGSDIGGQRTSPLTSWTVVKDKVRFDSLIKMRTDFNDKLAASVYEM